MPEITAETDGSGPVSGASPQTQTYGFLLVPQYSMISFTAVLEPLRMANRVAGRPLYRWQLFSRDDQPVVASNGLVLPPTAPFDAIESVDTLLVVAGIDAHLYRDKKVSAMLRRLVREDVPVGATSTGTLILARAGVLDGYRCTVHWENRTGLSELFPNLDVTSEIFEIDRNRLTCSGGTAGLDMMLHLIALRHGQPLANAVAEQCIHPNIRPAHDRQRMAMQHRLEVRNPRVLAVIARMESQLEEPWTPQELAETANVSLRQLERLFKAHAGRTVAGFYLELRLLRARALLQQTAMSVVEVGAACGFVSASHFGRCYRSRFGHTPREGRSSS